MSVPAKCDYTKKLCFDNFLYLADISFSLDVAILITTFIFLIIGFTIHYISGTVSEYIHNQKVLSYISAGSNLPIGFVLVTMTIYPNHIHQIGPMKHYYLLSGFILMTNSLSILLSKTKS